MTLPRVDVVHVVLKFDKGGLEMTALNLCRGLRDRGFASAVVALDGSGETFGLAQSEGFDCVALAGRRILSPSFHAKLHRELHRLRPRVIHTHHFSSLIHSFPAGALSGPFRRVHTEHSSLYLTERPAYQRALRWASRSVDTFVPVAKSMEPLYLGPVGVDRSRLRVIPNGIDVHRFQPGIDLSQRTQLRKRLGIPDGMVVGAVGRLADVKNYRLLIEAVAEARREYQDLSLVLIGEGESRESLQQQVDQLGLRERVLFAGWRHDTGDWLRAFDLFALSSISEALPLALLEAMASGLPVLATAVGDVTDIVNQAGCGLSVPVGDDLGYARALRELLADRERRLAFGLRAREYAVAHHSIDAMVGEYLTAYRFS